jgi:hypothetical protein
VNGNETTRKLWFKEPKDEAHKVIFDTCRNIIDNSNRLSRITESLRFYNPRGYRYGPFNNALNTNTNLSPATSMFIVGPEGRIQDNVVRPIIDALVAKIGAETPKPKFMVKGGDFKAERKGQQLDTFSAGQFYKHQIYTINQRIFVDACLHGSGFMHIYPDVDIDDILVEHAWAGQIWVDEEEAKWGYPRNIYRIIEVDKEWLCGKYPKAKDEIMESKVVTQQSGTWERKTTYNPVSLIVSYHLADTQHTNDGRYVLSVENATFCQFKLYDDGVGFYGSSLVDILAAKQNDITYFAQQIQAHATRMSATLLVDGNATLSLEEIANNKDLKAIKVRGAPIGQLGQWLVTSSQPMDSWTQYKEQLRSSCYNDVGLSEDFSQGSKPQGVNSGEAQRTLRDIQTMRFKHIDKRWEQYNMDIAGRLVDCARFISKHGEKSYKILSECENKLLEISWKDIDLDKDSYIIKAMPMSLLPDTPSGAIQSIQDISQVAPDLQPYLPMLLQYPDLQSTIQRNFAPQIIARKVVDSIIVDDAVVEPDPDWDLDVVLKEATLGYQDACVRGADERILINLRTFMDNIRYMQELKVKKMAQMQNTMQPAPQPHPVVPQQGQGAMPQPMPQ